MKLDTLDALQDDELRAIAGRCEALLKQHDTERKDKALGEARALLASVGLSLKDVARKVQPKSRASVYHAGRSYQHPANKAQVWSGKGKKPGWLTTLEEEGRNAIEVAANDNPLPVRKAG